MPENAAQTMPRSATEPSPAAGAAAPGTALLTLLEELRPKLRRILYGFRIPPQDADDVLQTTLLLALRHWQKIQHPRAWLIATLEKRCIIYWRGRRQSQSRDMPLDDLKIEIPIAPPQERREMLSDLETLSRLLPVRHRLVLALRYEGLKVAEVAKAAGIRASSVRKLSLRALARLRKAVGPRPALNPGRFRGIVPSRRQGGLPSLADHLRRKGGGAAAWMVDVDAFLNSVRHASRERRQAYTRHLAAAGMALGFPRLGEVSIAELAGYAAALLLAEGQKSTVRCALATFSSFLAWAGECGKHGLDPEAIRAALRAPRPPVKMLAASTRVGSDGAGELAGAAVNQRDRGNG